MNLLTQLDDILLEVNLAIGEELTSNLLHLLRIRLLLDQIQGLLELIRDRRARHFEIVLRHQQKNFDNLVGVLFNESV